MKRLFIVALLIAAFEMLSAGQDVGTALSYRDSTVNVTEEGDVITKYYTLPIGKDVVPVSSEQQEDPYLSDPMCHLIDNEPENNALSAPQAMAAQLLQAGSGAFGRIPYSEGITPSGARIYGIPVATAPDVPFAPAVSLVYNSQSSEGVAGYGWTITGLSSIVRTGKSMYYHAKVSAPLSGEADAAFCLDGVPIVQSTMLSGYPYETARGHILVKKYPSSSAPATYFEVLYPSGSKAVFGFRDTSSGQVSYPLTEITDINGNKVTVSYTESGGKYYPETVNYDFDDSGIARCQIKFTYSSRYGYKKYYAGEEFLGNRILKSIVSEDGGETLCKYSLEYEEKDYTYLLSSIGCICGNSSLNPLKFTYGSQDQMQEDDFSNPGGPCILDKTFTGVDVRHIRGKFRSGHYSDGLIILPSLSNYTLVETYEPKFLGITTAISRRFGSGYSPGQSILILPSVGFYGGCLTIKADEGFQTIEAIDVDDDGADEIVKVNFNGIDGDYSGLRIAVYKFNETTARLDSTIINTKVAGVIPDGKNKHIFYSPQRRMYLFGKFSDFGGAQLVTISYNKDFKDAPHLSRTAVIDLKTKVCKEYELFDLGAGTESCFLPFDIDNDGKGNLCHATMTGLEHYKYNNGQFTKDNEIAGNVNSTLLQNTVFFTDMNGDGLLDIVKPPKQSYYETYYPGYDPSSGEDKRDYEAQRLVSGGTDWDVYSYTGEKFVRRTCHAITNDPGDKFLFLDINQDGLGDLVKVNGTQVAYYINNLGEIRNDNEVVSKLKYPVGSGLIPANVVRYNSASEFIIVDGFYVYGYEFSGNRSMDRLLTSMTDSYGVTMYNTYQRMSGISGVYQTDSQRNYSLADGYSRRTFPLNLLYSTETYLSSERDISERTVSRYYTYFDAVCHSKGLGFCGFGKTRIIDYIDNTVTSQEYDPEKFGVPIRRTVALRSSSDSPFAETVNTYDNNSTTYGKLNPRLKKSFSTDHLSGVVTGTYTEYGEYDFPTLIGTTKKIDGSGKMEQHDYTYTHSITADRYVLGAVKKETEKRSKYAFGGSDWSKTTEFTYDHAFRPLTRKIKVGKRSLQKSGDETLADGQYRVPPQPDTLSPIVPDPSIGPIDTLPHIPVDPYEPDAGSLLSETRWKYDSRGKVISEKTARYGATAFVGKTFEYDSDGRHLHSITDELGLTTVYEAYDKLGNPTKVTDHNGNSTSYTYDDRGNLLTASYPDGTSVDISYGWGGEGLYTKTETSNVAPETIVHYDALGREIRTGVKRFDGQWQFTDNVYNSRGLLEKRSMPFRGTLAKSWTVLSYDEYGRPVSIKEPSGMMTSWTYDGASVTETKDGISTTRTIDANGDIVKVTDPGGTIEYSLNDIGQPESITAPGGVKTTFTYDAYWRRSKMEDPSAGTWTDSYVCNADGSSVVTRTNPNGKVVTYTDKYGRTTKVERPGEYNTSYTYDADGRLLKEESTNGTGREYWYDSHDRVTSIKETVPDGKWLEKTCTYGNGSQVATVGYTSQSGYLTTENYSYANGYNTAVTLPDGTVVLRIEQENDLGQTTRVTTGGTTREYGFSSSGVPTFRKIADGELQDFEYAINAMTGNMLMRKDGTRDLVESFGYDSLNRLVAIAGRNVSYAANGNITSMDGVGDMSYGNAAKPYRLHLWLRQMPKSYLTDPRGSRTPATAGLRDWKKGPKVRHSPTTATETA